MTAAPQMTAREGFALALAEVRKNLKTIEGRIEILVRMQKSRPNNWGLVGDLGALRERLEVSATACMRGICKYPGCNEQATMVFPDGDLSCFEHGAEGGYGPDECIDLMTARPVDDD